MSHNFSRPQKYDDEPPLTTWVRARHIINELESDTKLMEDFTLQMRRRKISKLNLTKTNKSNYGQ